jgi:DNA adenine methylase
MGDPFGKLRVPSLPREMPMPRHGQAAPQQASGTIGNSEMRSTGLILSKTCCSSAADPNLSAQMFARSKLSRLAVKKSSNSGQGAEPRKPSKRTSVSVLPLVVAEETAHASGQAETRVRRDSQLELTNAIEERTPPPEAQPFLKWVGGKAQLLKQFDCLFPRQIDRYFEPFIGGGAVFFHLKHRFPHMRARLCDINGELINTYRAVRDFPSELMARLNDHLTRYNLDRDRHYYLVRSWHHLPRTEVVERAARMIFLNKTCFNGLWRVNARGEFNVPIGSHQNPALYNRQNMLAASAALQGVELHVRDFRDALMETQAGDFVYVDPPYMPVSLTANFTSYGVGGRGHARNPDSTFLHWARSMPRLTPKRSNSEPTLSEAPISRAVRALD